MPLDGIRFRAWIDTTELAAVSTADASCDDSSDRVLELPAFCGDMRAWLM
jgi:hypothetical protein